MKCLGLSLSYPLLVKLLCQSEYGNWQCRNAPHIWPRPFCPHHVCGLLYYTESQFIDQLWTHHPPVERNVEYLIELYPRDAKMLQLNTWLNSMGCIGGATHSNQLPFIFLIIMEITLMASSTHQPIIINHTCFTKSPDSSFQMKFTLLTRHFSMLIFNRQF